LDINIWSPHTVKFVFLCELLVFFLCVGISSAVVLTKPSGV
jgi:hypothetical protein